MRLTLLAEATVATGRRVAVDAEGTPWAEHREHDGQVRWWLWDELVEVMGVPAAEITEVNGLLLGWEPVES